MRLHLMVFVSKFPSAFLTDSFKNAASKSGVRSAFHLA